MYTTPPCNNKEGAEILLQEYFKFAKDSIFTYIKTKRRVFVSACITPRSDRITYSKDDTITDEQLNDTKKFIDATSITTFPHIDTVSVELIQYDINFINKKETGTRADALIEKWNTSTITAATVETLETEASTSSKTTISIIDDRTNILIENINKISKKNQNKRTWKRKKQRRYIHITYLHQFCHIQFQH